jgi:hypothetical protein
MAGCAANHASADFLAVAVDFPVAAVALDASFFLF